MANSDLIRNLKRAEYYSRAVLFTRYPEPVPADIAVDILLNVGDVMAAVRPYFPPNERQVGVPKLRAQVAHGHEALRDLFMYRYQLASGSSVPDTAAPDILDDYEFGREVVRGDLAELEGFRRASEHLLHHMPIAYYPATNRMLALPEYLDSAMTGYEENGLPADVAFTWHTACVVVEAAMRQQPEMRHSMTEADAADFLAIDPERTVEAELRQAQRTPTESSLAEWPPMSRTRWCFSYTTPPVRPRFSRIRSWRARDINASHSCWRCNSTRNRIVG